MNEMIKQAVDHWHYVSPLLTKPETKEDFDAFVEALLEMMRAIL